MFYALTLPAYLEKIPISGHDLTADFAHSASAWAQEVLQQPATHVYAHPAIASLPGRVSGYFPERPSPPALPDHLYGPGFDIFQKKIFPATIQYLKQHPPQQTSRLFFSHTFQIKPPKGRLASYLQTNRFLVSPAGIPLATAGHVVDISPYKKDNSIVHVIEDRAAAEHERVLLEKHYYPDAASPVLSNRELEVLKFIAEGLSSKQIAGKIGISINTVNNHRNKMLQRTDCRNSYELIIYGVKNNLL